MKTYYSDYARHCLRFYCRCPHPAFQSDAAKHDWYAGKRAVESFTPRHQALLQSLYQNRDTLEDAVYAAAQAAETDQGKIWKLVCEAERRVAKNRGVL